MVKIKKIVATEEIIDKEIQFPYYGYYDSDKTRIIKITKVLHENSDNIKHIKVVSINKKSIYVDIIPVIDNIADNDLDRYLDDSNILATESDFAKLFGQFVNSCL